MSTTKENEMNPNAMYRYDPELGYVEVTNNQAMQTTMQNPMQNQAYFANQNNPYFVPPIYQQNIPQYAPFAYCPPFGPRMMMYNNQMQQQALYQTQMQQAEEMHKMQEEFAKYMNKMQAEQTANTANAQQGLTQEKVQEIYNVVNDAINGNADPNKIFGILQGTSNDFWKGLAIGAGAILLFNYTPLKTMFASMLGSFGASQAEEASEETCDCNNTETE